MSTGTIVAVIVIVLIVVALAAVGVTQVRRRRLRERFGPEYDRVVEETDSRRKAEAELTERERRVKGLDIRPLDPATRTRHADQWRDIQERFVDVPPEAVAEAQMLVVTVMTERGYPTEHEGQVLADLSVGHAQTLDSYRAASDISARATSGTASTEDLRQAMIHYRVLFQDLLGEPASVESPGVESPGVESSGVESPDVESAPVQPAGDQEVSDPRPDTTVLDGRRTSQQHNPGT
jgi:Tfp pilus assembly protein PilX